MTDRIPCIVPFCRRFKKGPAEKIYLPDLGISIPADRWLCAKHWPLVPARMRRVVLLASRRLRADPCHRRARLAARLWWHCERKAIEAAGGIA